MQTGEEVCERLQKAGYQPSLINARFLKPLDQELLRELPEQHSLIVTMEEGVITGGFGQTVAAWYETEHILSVQVYPVALPDQFIEHGSVGTLRDKYGISAEGITERVLQQISLIQ